ncbi:MAG: zf-HC2 domain-containing protein [Acidobacteriota bacterium]|nr:zf-HC2 domain-containing protein [Acidobacteriota bacterium]
MDCRGLVERLDRLLEGRLDGRERRETDEHLSHCPSCRELTRAAGTTWTGAAVEPPQGLTASILDRTSGAPCDPARHLLCAFVDRTLPPVDRELVRLHVMECEGCGSLARVLAVMREELPVLAEMRPDAGFVGDVLAQTSHRGARAAAVLERIREAWQGLLLRPRIAWESAYVGAAVLALVFGLPGSPLAGVPHEALELASLNPVAEIERPAARLTSRISTRASSAWRVTREWIEEASNELVADASRKSSATAQNIFTDLGTFRERLTSEPMKSDAGRPQDGPEPAEGDER